MRTSFWTTWCVTGLQFYRAGTDKPKHETEIQVCDSIHQNPTRIKLEANVCNFCLALLGNAIAYINVFLKTIFSAKMGIYSKMGIAPVLGNLV